MEHWIEINLDVDIEDQDDVLLKELRPHVDRLKKAGALLTWHYFREPELRFRMRLKSRADRKKEVRTISALANSLKRKRLVSEWHLGNHGEEGREYAGEEDRYGRNGWKAAQLYFDRGSETALDLLALKRRSGLENPLWGRGFGNPWEGGERNPWREKVDDPLVYHWSRYVHLFSNQLGFDMSEEADLCSKQAERYRRVTKDFGMKW